MFALQTFPYHVSYGMSFIDEFEGNRQIAPAESRDLVAELKYASHRSFVVLVAVER